MLPTEERRIKKKVAALTDDFQRTIKFLKERCVRLQSTNDTQHNKIKKLEKEIRRLRWILRGFALGIIVVLVIKLW